MSDITAPAAPQLTPSRADEAAWSGPLLVVAVLAALLAGSVTPDVWTDLFQVSLRDEESGHMLFVPLVAVVLLWVRRGQFRLCRVSDPWIGPLLVGLGWGMWSTGYRFNHNSLWHLGAILMPVGMLVTFLGKDAILKFLPVLGLLIFLIPVLNGRRHVISEPLERATAEITRAICDVLGMRIERHGNLLIVNGVNMTVAEACNGMRMVFTLFLMSYLYAFASPLGPLARTAVLLLSPVMAIACNVIRLVPTAWVFGNEPRPFAERFHDLSGWAMLIVGFLLLTGLVKVLRRASGSARRQPQGAG